MQILREKMSSLATLDKMRAHFLRISGGPNTHSINAFRGGVTRISGRGLSKKYRDA